MFDELCGKDKTIRGTRPDIARSIGISLWCYAFSR